MLEKLSKVSQMRRRAMVAGAIATGAAVFAHPRSADAELIVTLTDLTPGNTVLAQTIYGVTPGIVYNNSSFGPFSTTFEVGISNVNMPTNSTAYLQLQSFGVTSYGTGPQTIEVNLEESTPFTFPGSASSTVTLTSALGGTLTPPNASDFVEFESSATVNGGSGSVYTPGYGDASPGVPAPGSGYATGSFNIPTLSTNFVQTPSFVLDSDLQVTLNNQGEAFNVSGTATVSVPVPEPVSAGLIGGAGLLLLGRRRRI